MSGQIPVVKSSAVSYPSPAPVKGHARHNHQTVAAVCRRKPLFRLPDAEVSGFQILFPVYPEENHLFSLNFRSRHLLSPGQGLPEDFPGHYFIAAVYVQINPPGPVKFRKRNHPAADLVAVPENLLLWSFLPETEYFFPNVCFCLHIFLPD